MENLDLTKGDFTTVAAFLTDIHWLLASARSEMVSEEVL